MLYLDKGTHRSSELKVSDISHHFFFVVAFSKCVVCRRIVCRPAIVTLKLDVGLLTRMLSIGCSSLSQLLNLKGRMTNINYKQLA